MATVWEMLRACKLACVVYVVMCLGGISRGADDVYAKTLPAIMQVESRGDANAVGDGGRAVGPYQIHRGYWTTATRLLGVDWPYSEAVDYQKAELAVQTYTRHYAKHYKQPLTPETIARIHNGGPTGWKKKATLPYWKKVEKVLGM